MIGCCRRSGSEGLVSKTQTRIALVVASGIALAVPPLVLRAEPEGFDEVRHRMATMTQTERDRFERNSRDYLNLSEEERSRFRAMHAELERDREENQGRLSGALSDYYAWLSTLENFSRQELRTATDPQERIKTIEAALEEQSQQQLRELPWTRPFLGRFPVLTSEQLAALVEALKRNVSLNQEQARQLNSLRGIEHHLAFFQILRERDQRLEQLLDRAGAERLLEILPQENMPNWTGEEDIAQRRRSFLSQLLFWNMFKEYQLEIRRRRPSAEDLQRFVANWPADRRAELDQLLELEPDEFRERLEREYAAQHLDLDWEVVPQVILGPDYREHWGRGPRRSGSRSQFDGGERRPEGRRGENDPDRRPPPN